MNRLPPKCIHYRLPTVHPQTCRIGEFGGAPTWDDCEGCPKMYWPPKRQTAAVVQVRVPTAEQRAAAEEDRIRRFHEAWRAIHTLALVGGLTDVNLLAIVKEMPQGGCSCRSDFMGILTSEPLPADAAGQFALSVGWHNVVNAKLGKPLMTVDEARPLYATPPTTAAS